MNRQVVIVGGISPGLLSSLYEKHGVTVVEVEEAQEGERQSERLKRALKEYEEKKEAHNRKYEATTVTATSYPARKPKKVKTGKRYSSYFNSKKA